METSWKVREIMIGTTEFPLFIFKSKSKSKIATQILKLKINPTILGPILVSFNAYHHH